MKSIRVVHVANIDVGLRVHLGNYMRYQQAQGYDVSAVCPPGRWLTQDTTILDGVSVKIVPFEARISPLADLATLIRLVAHFRREQFQIVHTHAVKPGLLGRLAARLVGIPVIVHTIHGFYFYEGMSPLEYRLFVMVEKLGAACCDSILSQNRQDIETAISQGICEPDKVHFLGNGIDLTRFDPDSISEGQAVALRTEIGLAPLQPVIGFVARLVREKGIHEFLEAASLLKSQGIEAKYLVIGVSQEGRHAMDSLESLLHQYGVEDSVIHLGYRDDMPQLLKLMDMIVLPSYGREGVPRILMEAAALGKPVVATRVRGNVEAVEDGQTGLLVPPRNGPALAESILRLMQDPQLAAEMGRRARRRALTHFDERHFFWRTDVEYRRLLRKALAEDPDLSLAPVPANTLEGAP